MSKFSELLKVDVNEHKQQKGRFSYLSWPFAVSELRKAAPDATWETIHFDGKPFMVTECGYFVEVAVTVDGITLAQIHPVLNHQNKTIEKPNAFDINTSIQRCLVKAIALHGLGLYIYSGEDLPEGTEEPEVTLVKAIEYLKTAKDLDDLDVKSGNISEKVYAQLHIREADAFDAMVVAIAANLS